MIYDFIWGTVRERPWPWVLEAQTNKRSLRDAEAIDEARQFAENTATEEEDLQLEVERIQVDEDGVVVELRVRRKENIAKFVAAARSLHAINLRAYVRPCSTS